MVSKLNEFHYMGCPVHVSAHMCPVCVQVSTLASVGGVHMWAIVGAQYVCKSVLGGGGGGGGGKLSLHLNDGWYDAVHGLGDDEEAVHVVLSGHVGSHKGEDGHDVV